MPELPEVETVRRELAPWLTGRNILEAARVDAPPGPKYAHLARAEGQRIEAVERRGKFLLLPLSRGDALVIHLGMTGVISATQPSDHVRVHLHLDGSRNPHLYFRDPRRFGRFLVLPQADPAALPTLARMGPEPLSPAFSVAALRAGLRSRSGIKALLLSQRPVAGLGNIYVDEALWRARIHPETAAEDVSAVKCRRLHGAIVDVIEAAIAAQGTTLNDYRTVNGGIGEYRNELNAYGHAGDPCPRCGTPIRRIVCAQRGTCFCPRCQRRGRPPGPR